MAAELRLNRFQLFRTYFWLLHPDGLFYRVRRATVGVAAGCHLYVITGQKVHRDTANILAVIVGERDGFAVLTFLSLNIPSPL
ncbi:hypothetical protein KU75_25855 [Pectobacterium odoriferum]|uniref:Uncharacterized protein n=1 Tax=Pectobacterium odoriferum TaxID=78398 RepID=A0ABR4VHZ9_9GAMM|nr:hypothetical protein KU75_25855 [Pectobacterium odoriferum]